ncbi:MAG: LacI family DNA-binding transcriptional regulator [Actinobacteria bacterium]|nr:LacI family DNA-binding transcriptional regulator [Actinomycetota bacterium]
MARTGPTSGDVAKLAKVSRPTVNRVLGGYGYASEEATARVLAAAEQLGYRPNAAARTLLTGRSRSVGIVVVDIANPFFSSIVSAVCDRMLTAGYETFIMSSDGDTAKERIAVDAMLSKQVEGMIVAPTSVTQTDHLRAVGAAGLPLVLIDRVPSNVEGDAIDIDNVAAGYDATSRLLAEGRRRVAIISHGQGGAETDWAHLDDVDRGRLNPSALRLLGYLQAYRDAGLKPNPRLVQVVPAQTKDEARRASTRLLDAGMDGLFVTDNVLSIGAYLTLAQAKVRLPDELSLIVFDDVDWTALTTPPLTVVSQPFQTIGEESASRLLQRLQGTPENASSERHRVPHEIVVRGSTRPIPTTGVDR